jgi:hypothetical protein
VFNGTCEMPSARQDDASHAASDGTTTPTPSDSM